MSDDDVIRLYLDDDVEPFKTARPPLRFQFSTLHLADGQHKLRIEAHNGLAGDSVREIPFHVRNGVAITVSGLESGQEIAGQVGVIINAYAGNTEVDFEPSRAETPQPIPTWAWLIFLAIAAFTMFYVLNAPHPAPMTQTADIDARMGERVFVDQCSKCHQEDGLGLGDAWPAPRLKDSDIVLDNDPTSLVTFVVAGPPPASSVDTEEIGTGRPRLRMPEWGTRLSGPEVVAALNHVRTHWGNQAPMIVPSAKRPPEAIRNFEKELGQALQGADLASLERHYSVNPVQPVRLVRPDDLVDVSGPSNVLKALRDWLQSVESINSLAPEDASYAVADNTVYAHGTLVLSVSEKNGNSAKTYRGPFVRVWVNEWHLFDRALNIWKWAPDGARTDRRKLPPGVELQQHWVLAFDWARIPMRIGCVQAGSLPEKGGGFCPPSVAAETFFADIVRMITDLNQSAPRAPHGNFWTKPYDEFIKLEFPYRPSFPGQPAIPGGTIKLINFPKEALGQHAADTNFVKALRDGKDIVVDVPGKPSVTVDITRMPRDKPAMNPNDLARVEAWIAKGMPEKRPPPAEVEPNLPPPTTPANGGTPTNPPPTNPTNPPPNDGTTTPPPPAADTIKFADVLEILKKLGPRASGSPHGKFWEKPYAEFIAYEFDWPAASGSVPLIDKGHGADSNLVRALRGQPLKVKDPSTGKVSEQPLGKFMPPSGKGQKMSEDDIVKIEKWIDAGAPEK